MRLISHEFANSLRSGDLARVVLDILQKSFGRGRQVIRIPHLGQVAILLFKSG